MNRSADAPREWFSLWSVDLVASLARVAALRRTVALFGIALVAATWPLWTPQHVFPQVPLLAGLQHLPDWFQWGLLAGMLLGLAGTFISAGQSGLGTVSLLMFAGATAGLMLADQHRLQPWAYQFVLVAIVLAVSEPRAAVGWLRLLIVSFYFHSAITKLDYSFAHTLGQQFLMVLVRPLGLAPENWSEATRVLAALAFPTGELIVALTLCLARTRSLGLVAAIFLHVLLLVILGPWGLNHKPGVLLWNLYFIVQDLILFGPWPRTSSSSFSASDTSHGPARAPLAVRGMLLAAMVLPVLEPTGWFDMWPSWGLYASSAERVQLLVHRVDVARLPEALGPYVEPLSDADEPWLALRLDRWSLAALGAPLYPQNRFQLGVCEAVLGRYDLGHRVRVVRWGLAQRLSGARRYDILSGLPQLVFASEDYLLNSRPSSRPLRP